MHSAVSSLAGSLNRHNPCVHALCALLAASIEIRLKQGMAPKNYQEVREGVNDCRIHVISRSYYSCEGVCTDLLHLLPSLFVSV